MRAIEALGKNKMQTTTQHNDGPWTCWFEFVDISIIEVRKQHRVDPDLEPLIESIRNHGLLQPILVTSKFRLIFGERRLAACKILAWTEIQCVVHSGVCSELDIHLMRLAENIQRRDLNVQELGLGQ